MEMESSLRPMIDWFFAQVLNHLDNVDSLILLIIGVGPLRYQLFNPKVGAAKFKE